MTTGQWTVHDIALHRDMTDGGARAWVSEQVRAGRLTSTGRDQQTGAKLYRRDDVLAVIAAMPGKGRRTDLRGQRDDRPRDHEP